MKNIIKLKQKISELSSYAQQTGSADIAERLEQKSQEMQTQRTLKEINISVEDAASFLGDLIAHQMIVRSAHWATKGANYYGDHLLFERIYNNLNEELDKVAEKFVALVGDEVVDPMMLLGIAHGLSRPNPAFSPKADADTLAEMVINSEITLMTHIETFYDKLKEQDNLTLGLDDFIMSLHSNHEDIMYLLTQRNKTS